MSLLDRIKQKLNPVIEPGKRASESASDFAAAADAFHKFSPLLSFIDRYLPPVAIVTSGFALIFDMLDVSIQRRIDRFIASKLGLGAIIVAAGILGLTLPIVTAAMFGVVVTAGLGKQIVDFVKDNNAENHPDVTFEKKLNLASSSIAWAGALLLIIGGVLFPPLAIAGFGLLLFSIAAPLVNKFWQRFNSINEATDIHNQHNFDSTARASFEIAEAEAQEAHEVVDESNVKHKAIEEIQHGLEHAEETQEVEPIPVMTESLVMPLHTKPEKKESSKDEADDNEGEGEGGKVSEENTPKSHF